MAEDNLESKLDRLWVEYRNACPDVDGNANFMPQLWQRIEARQNLPFVMGRFVRGFVSAALVMCLAMTLFNFIPGSQAPLTYLSILDQEHPTELIAYGDLDDESPGAWQ
jgi:hypothetical protein